MARVRTGPEQFILKDFAFYDAMVMPALGLEAVAIYEVLRRHVWRSSTKGVGRSRRAFQDGRLASSISQKKIALLTGLSPRTIDRHLPKLRAVGWVRGPGGYRSGETLVYELGTKSPGESERFYADDSLRALWYGLEELAEKEGLDGVSSLPCEDRLAFARLWFDRPVEGVEDSEVDSEVAPNRRNGSVTEAEPRPGGSVRPTHIIENPPSGGEIEKKKCVRRCAPSHIEPEPNPLVRAAESSREEEGPKFAIDNETPLGQDGKEDRFQRMRMAAEVGRDKATQQVEVNRQRAAILRSRSDQVASGEKKRQLQANRAGGTRATTSQLREGRKVWEAYTEALGEHYSALPTVEWMAPGNVKPRDLMCKLLSMYGAGQLRQAVRYMVANWDAINAKFFKRAPGSPPNFRLLYSMHEEIVSESVVWEVHRPVVEEWREWVAAHPGKRPPSDLRDRHEAAKKALEAIGVTA